MIKDVLKRQTVVIAVAVIGVCLCLMGVSYAVFFDIDKGNAQTITSGDLTIQFSKGQDITTATKPQSDSDGVKNSYEFSVTNNGSLPMNYNIYLYNDPTAGSNEDLELIPHDYLRVQLDNEEIQNLNLFTEADVNGVNMRKINTKDLTVGDKDDTDNNVKAHSIKIWIDEDAPEDIIGNTIALQLVVLGEAEGSSGGGVNS